MANNARKVDLTERRRAAVDLRNNGATWQAIADELGYPTRGAACQDVTRALAAAMADLTESVGEWRRGELAKLATYESEATEILLAEHPVVQGGEIVADVTDAGPALRAIQTLLRVAERRARLLGLDSPEKVQVEGSATVRHVLEGVDVEGL